MAVARSSLLHAAAKSGAEDRLTELFATVLAAHRELAVALFTEVGLAVGERFRVSTQVSVAPGERPDMVLEALGRNGAVVARLWSEHKVDARFGDRQRERYLAALRARDGPGKLIFVVRDVPTAREDGDWRGFTWQEVAELVDRVGRDWGGPGWRVRAADPEAPAKQRLLYELLWYLEDKDLAVVHSLNADNLLAFKLRAETDRAVLALLERAAQNAAPLEPVGGDDEDDVTSWEQFKVPAGSWLPRFARFEAVAELMLSDRDYWSPSQHDEPSFGAGYALEAPLHSVLSAGQEWVEQLDAGGFSCELWTGYVRVYRTMPMSELLGAGDSLNAQAWALGAWARDAILELGRLDPGEVALPHQPRKR
jgi:hypothetical protein